MKVCNIPINKGECLSCSLTEVWEQVLSKPLVCGQKYKRVVKRKTGVIEEQREDLNSTIKDSFGIKGLAQLELAIQAGIGTSIKFEQYNEVEETIEVKAPKYGRYVLSYFQKKQIYQFEGRDSKYFFWSKPWTLIVQRWLDEWRDESLQFEFDPQCKGKVHAPQPPDGIIDFVTHGGKLTIATPYRIKEDGIEFDRLGLRTDVGLLDIMSSKTSLPLDALPKETQLISGIKDKHIDAIVMQYGGTMGEFSPSQYEYCFPATPVFSRNFPRLLKKSEDKEKFVWFFERPPMPMEAYPFVGTSPSNIHVNVNVPDIKRMWTAIEGLPLIDMKTISKDK